MSPDRNAAKPAPERLTSDPSREVSLFLVEYQVFCQVHRRFILRSWAVGIISTYLFAPSYTVSVSGSLRKPLRSLPDLYPSHCRSHQNSVTPEVKGAVSLTLRVSRASV